MAARSVGDSETEELRADNPGRRAEHARAGDAQIPKLVDAVVRADVEHNPSYDVSTTGAADTVREAAAATRTAGRKTTTATKRAARTARKVPGVAPVEGQVKGAVAEEADLGIARYDTLTAEEIIDRLSGLSQIDLAKVDSYESRNQNQPPSSVASPPCAAASPGPATTG